MSDFLELISGDDTATISADLSKLSPGNAVESIIARAPRDRLQVLALNRARLLKVTAVTAAFGEAAKKYDPEGLVRSIDMFWVSPLQSVASSRQE